MLISSSFIECRGLSSPRYLIFGSGVLVVEVVNKNNRKMNKEYLVYYSLWARIGMLQQPYSVKVFTRNQNETAIDFVHRIQNELLLLNGDHYTIQITDVKLFE